MSAMILALVTACGDPPWKPQTAEERLIELPRAHVSVEALSADISYLHGGDEGGAPVILVHGTPGSADGWGDYLMAVPEGRYYVAIDRPGFGQSGPDDAVTSLSAQAAAIAAVVDDLRAKGNMVKPVLVGYSLGGPIVAQAAVDRPELYGALVILAGSLDPGLEKLHFMQPVGEWWGVRHALPRSMRNANSELIALEPELRALQPRLGDISLPVIVVHGTADKLVPYDNVPFMEREMSSTRLFELVRLEGQNHFLPWNSMPVVEQAIERAIDVSGADGMTEVGQ